MVLQRLYVLEEPEFESILIIETFVRQVGNSILHRSGHGRHRVGLKGR